MLEHYCSLPKHEEHGWPQQPEIKKSSFWAQQTNKAKHSNGRELYDITKSLTILTITKIRKEKTCAAAHPTEPLQILNVNCYGILCIMKLIAIWIISMQMQILWSALQRTQYKVDG